jgi:hypothetical protein
VKALLSPSPPWFPKACSSPTNAFERALQTLQRSGEERASRLDDPCRKTHQCTVRTARIEGNIVICRPFVRWVFTVITRIGGSIAHISQIATAGPTSEFGGFRGVLGF